MSRQKTIYVPRISLDRHRPKRDRIWFNLSDDSFHDRSVLDYGAVTAEHGRDIGISAVFAVRKDDEREIRACLKSLAKDPSSADAQRRLQSFQAAEGHLIPFTVLDDTWQRPGSLGAAELLEIAVGIQLRILHIVAANSLHGTTSPLAAWKTGYGQCFDRASIIVAAYRKNNIPARVVGNNGFFGKDGEHWRVEAFVSGQLKEFDSTYNIDFIKWVIQEAVDRGVSRSDFPAFLLRTMDEYSARGVAVNQITSAGYEQKVRSKTIAAESDKLDL